MCVRACLCAYVFTFVQSVPGPGQYEIRSQFVRSPLDEEDDVEEIPVVPFGSTQQVCHTQHHSQRSTHSLT